MSPSRPSRPSRPFFFSSSAQENLRRILVEWEGTPYRHHCGVKQGGADCIQFVGRVMQEAGALEHYDFPEYPPDWHLHQTEERLLNGMLDLVRQGIAIAVDPDAPENGDVLLFGFGRKISRDSDERVAAHSAIYLDGQLWQAVSGIGVLRTQYRDGQWYPRRRFAFRFLSTSSIPSMPSTSPPGASL